MIFPKRRRKTESQRRNRPKGLGGSTIQTDTDASSWPLERGAEPYKLPVYARVWHRFFGTRRKRLIGAAGGVALLACYGVVASYIPNSVSFAYAGQTCRKQLTVLPGIQRQLNATKFTISHAGVIAAGSLQIASTQLCFTPKTAPSPGEVRVALAPFGGPIFRSNYRVVIGEQPKILSSLTALSTAVTKPLKLTMSQPDETFQYYVQAQDRSQRCSVESTVLACKIDKLQLEQGAEYGIRLTRSFGAQPGATLADASVKVLSPVRITDSSIKQDATVYDAPKQLTVTADKAVSAVRARLAKGAAGGAEVPITVSTSGTTVAIQWNDDLPREQSYTLTLTHVEATDGSTLTDPYELRFKTSGGPKVVGVSIGSAGVAPYTKAIVTFDQPLLGGSDIAKHASISGGTADIAGQGDRQVVFALKNIPPCGNFTLRITSGLSGKNEQVLKDDWAFGSQLSCRAGTEVIGYSVNGRPMTAYYYGTGKTTVLFVGGIHGTEPSGTYLMQDWVAYLDKNAHKIPADRRVVVVPSLNPDGIATGSRYNAHTVNLDRNFNSSDWVADIDTGSGIIQGGGGTAPFSEPESRAIANLTSRLKPRLVMSYHARGSLVGMNDFADSRAIGTVYATMLGYQTMFDNTEEIMGHTLTGEYETWIGETLGAPAVLIELPGYDGRYFSTHLNALWKMVGI